MARIFECDLCEKIIRGDSTKDPIFDIHRFTVCLNPHLSYDSNDSKIYNELEWVVRTEHNGIDCQQICGECKENLVEALKLALSNLSNLKELKEKQNE